MTAYQRIYSKLTVTILATVIGVFFLAHAANAAQIQQTKKTIVAPANKTTTLTKSPGIPIISKVAPAGNIVVSTAAADDLLESILKTNSSALPFKQPLLETLRASPKKVFAHYFTPFPISIDNKDAAADYYTSQYMSPAGENYKFAYAGGFIKQRPLPRAVSAAKTWPIIDSSQDIKRAAALGLDGFAADILDSNGPHANVVLRLLDTAYSTDTNFKIMLMPDMEAEFKAHPENVATVIRKFARHPATYRLDDGRVVLAPYNAQNQPVRFWQDLMAKMKAEGIELAFLPVFQNWGAYAKDFASISHGLSDWGERTPYTNQGWYSAPQKAHGLNMKWMAPVAPQDARPKDLVYWEAGNSENYRMMWENAIKGGADMVQVITWNDYSEASEIAPSTGTQWSFYDLTAYYTAWFKTGQRPIVTRDTLYYFHRTHATTALPDLQKQARAYTQKIAFAGPASDQIEVLAFATAPSSVEISIGGKTHVRSVAAGMTSIKVPLTEGTPVFRLIRQRLPLVTVQSQFPISNKIIYQDMLYRSGSSARALVAPR